MLDLVSIAFFFYLGFLIPKLQEKVKEKCVQKGAKYSTDKLKTTIEKISGRDIWKQKLMELETENAIEIFQEIITTTLLDTYNDWAKDEIITLVTELIDESLKEVAKAQDIRILNEKLNSILELSETGDRLLLGIAKVLRWMVEDQNQRERILIEFNNTLINTQTIELKKTFLPQLESLSIGFQEFKNTILDRIDKSDEKLNEFFNKFLKNHIIIPKTPDELTIESTIIDPPSLNHDIVERSTEFPLDFTEEYPLMDLVGVLLVAKSALPYYTQLYERFDQNIDTLIPLLRSIHATLSKKTPKQNILNKNQFSEVGISVKGGINARIYQSMKSGTFVVILVRMEHKLAGKEYWEKFIGNILGLIGDLDTYCNEDIVTWLGEPLSIEKQSVFHTYIVKNLRSALLFPLQFCSKNWEYLSNENLRKNQRIKKNLEKLSKECRHTLLLDHVWQRLVDTSCAGVEVPSIIQDLLEAKVLSSRQPDNFFFPIKTILPIKEKRFTKIDLKSTLQVYGLQDFFIPLEWELPKYARIQAPSIPSNITTNMIPFPITDTDTPKMWSKDWDKKWQPIISSEEGKNWIENRLKFFLNGTRGLALSCLSDVLLAVPPLVSMFNPLWHSLEKDRRTAVFSASGMGKSRIILYLAEAWKKEFPKGYILLCESPSFLFEDQWIGFGKFLDYLTQRIDKVPVLLIFEDLHQKGRANEKIQQLIHKRNASSTYWLGSYTTSRNLLTKEEEMLEDIWFDSNYKRGHIQRISQGWNNWRSFFRAWCHWIDDTTDYKIPLNINWETVTSPWEVTFITGQLRQKIYDYFQKCPAKKPIYWLHAALFLLHDEKPVPLDELLYVLQIGPHKQKELLKQILGGNEQDWKYKLIELIDEWERPPHLELPFSIRFLPPRPPQNIIHPEIRVNFFHQKLADELWSMDSQELEQILEFLKCAYIGLEQALEIFSEKENDQIITYADRLRCFTIQNRKIIGIDLSNFWSVSDITPLESCEDIQVLDLNWTKVADLSLLRSFKNLRELYLNRTEVIDFSALDYCENIEVLTLNRIEISDLELLKLSTLKFWKNLRELRLAGTKISDITPLKFCPKIQVLDLSITAIKKIDPLKYCKDLRILILNWTQISTVDTLTSCKNLQILDITGTAVKDYSILLKSIKNLKIYSSQLEEAKTKVRVLIATIGLDQYDISAPIVVRLLKDVGMEATYIGLINTPEQIVERALREEVDVIGLSFLAIPKFEFIPKLMKFLNEKKLTNVLVIAGGNIPKKEGAIIKNQGIAEVFFPNTPPLAIPKFIRENVRKNIN